MKEFIIYSILISLLYVYSGIGLAFLLCPKKLERYSLYLSPFVGLSYLSYIGWFFVNYSTVGTDVYAKRLLFPPIIFLIAAVIVKKERIGELLWPFRKENLLLIVICVIIFAGISAPFLLKVNGLNTITLGNNDIAAYAAVSKFMTKSSIFQYQIELAIPIRDLIEKTYFAAYFSTAIPSSIFFIEPYKLQNIVIYLFFIFSLPIVFLVGFEIFKYNRFMAMVITLLFGISFHLIYITYQGFLGQMIGTGIFLSLLLLTLYPLLNCDKLSCFISYIPLTVVFSFGLVISYFTLLPLFFIPLFMYLLLVYISTKSVSRLLNALSFLSLTLFVTLIVSPFLAINRIKLLSTFANSNEGWNMPILSPDWVFGLVGNNIWMQPVPFVYRVILSVPIILIIIASFNYLFKKERKIFCLSMSYIFFILLLYIYFIFTGKGYKAYKLITFFIPIIFLSGLSYFRNFHISSIKKFTKTQTLSMILLVFLLAGNIWSASAIITTNYYKSIPIKESIIDLQKITKMDNITSINIVEPPYWNQMWVYYFLFMDKKLYLYYSSYYYASPPAGEWTLQAVDPYDIITIINNEPNIIEINREYYLVQNTLEATLGKGWYELESNQYAKWRWTGNNNDTATIELYAQKDYKSVDFLLNYGSSDANNKFSVFLDDKKIKDCEDKNSCFFNDIYLSKGKHEMAFKTKLPPRLLGTGDPRTLSYIFSNIKIVVKNEESNEVIRNQPHGKS